MIEEEDDRLKGTNNVVAVHQAVNGLELLAQIAMEELRILRERIRQSGIRARRFLRDKANSAPLRRILLLCAEKFGALHLKKFSLDDSAEIGDFNISVRTNEWSSQRSTEWRIPEITWNDVEKVLTEDDVEDGVLRAFVFRCPKWEQLPVRVIPERVSDDLSEFQIFNRPMTLSQDDDDERQSTPSTRVTDQTSNIEAQLALLTSQVQKLLQERSRITALDSALDHTSSSPLVSDDEGKGDSMWSSTTSKKDALSPLYSGMTSATISEKEKSASMKNCIPPVAPPPGPPPPPPPPALLPPVAKTYSVQRTSSGDSGMLSDADGSVEQERPTFSALDLKSVKLRKTSSYRSPGGTPKYESRIRDDLDQGTFLMNALRKKFRNVENASFSEDDIDKDSSWVDE